MSETEKQLDHHVAGEKTAVNIHPMHVSGHTVSHKTLRKAEIRSHGMNLLRADQRYQSFLPAQRRTRSTIVPAQREILKPGRDIMGISIFSSLFVQVEVIGGR